MNNETLSEGTPALISEKLTIRLAGKEMNKEDGYQLDYILTTLQSVDKIAKKTYLHTNGGTRFTKQDEQNFSIRLMDVREGSFVSSLQIFYTDVWLPLVPVIIENREIILNSIKATFEFMKAKITATKEGKTVEIIQTTDTGGHNVNVQNISNSHVNIYVYPDVPALAEKVTPELAAITKIVDGDQIESLEISDGDSEPLLVSSEDQDLFSTSTYTQDEVFSVRGKIVDGDFTKLRGQIEITEASDAQIDIGETYKFRVNDNLHAENKWKMMFLEDRPYYCKKRIQIDPKSVEMAKVIELIIIDWDEQHWQ